MLRFSIANSSLVFARRSLSIRSSLACRRNFSADVPLRQPASLIGVAAALEAIKSRDNGPIKPAIFDGFSLAGRVGIVTGGNRGIGLEMALTLAEAGAKVYALDLPTTPGEDFLATQKYVERFGTGAKLEYIAGGVDVTDQQKVWDVIADIGDKEGRVDVGVAAAGILQGYPGLKYPSEEFQKASNSFV
jgi:hypothetical protein